MYLVLTRGKSKFPQRVLPKAKIIFDRNNKPIYYEIKNQTINDMGLYEKLCIELSAGRSVGSDGFPNTNIKLWFSMDSLTSWQENEEELHEFIEEMVQ